MTSRRAHLRRARRGDAEAITSLTLRSKRHWGYDEAFMATMTPALTCVPDDLLAGDQQVEVLEGSTGLLGFYRLRRLTELAFLEDLFVDPDAMGQGVGRQLFLRAASVAREWGAGVMEFESDPFAESFYLRLGAERVGMSPSQLLPGRSIPLMRYALLA
ncbi:MAG TPA: GNAT family N-acetyltransferase [Anaerolineae bacterium]|nr:GNAT family N-acetyltransferase [Anaerolineae bacterium]